MIFPTTGFYKSSLLYGRKTCKIDTFETRQVKQQYHILSSAHSQENMNESLSRKERHRQKRGTETPKDQYLETETFTVRHRQTHPGKSIPRRQKDVYYQILFITESQTFVSKC